MSFPCENCERLQQRIDALERALEMSNSVILQDKLKLPRRSAEILALFLRRSFWRVEAMAMVLWRTGTPERDDARATNNISVQMCRVRKAIKPLGISIETVWGNGYVMRPTDQRILRDLVSETDDQDYRRTNPAATSAPALPY